MRAVHTPITPETEPEIWRKAMSREPKSFPDCNLHWMDQRSTEWFEVRRGCLTATGMGAWLLKSDKTSQKAREAAICRLLSEIGQCYELPVFETEAMRRGTELEPEAVEEFEAWSGTKVTPCGFAKASFCRAGCSPDGLVMSEGIGFEGKCPTGAKHFEYVRAGSLPSTYEYQVHGSMAVTGARAWWFQSFHPGQASMRVLVERGALADDLALALIDFSRDLDDAQEDMKERYRKEVLK